MPRLPTKAFRDIIHSKRDIGFRCAQCGTEGAFTGKGRRLFRYLRRWRKVAAPGAHAELWDNKMFCCLNHRNAFFKARGIPTKPRLEVRP